jgi:hypothetical protein
MVRSLMALVLQRVLRREPNEEPAHSPGEFGGQPPTGDDDARVGSSPLQPAAVQTLEVDAVVRHEHSTGARREGELLSSDRPAVRNPGSS